MQLQTLNPQSLNIFSNDRDILRDLFTYLDYVGEREVKRMTRTNDIPHTDLKRLAKLLDIEPPEKDDWMYTAPHWMNFIDNLALRLQLVSYDTKGEYRGYSSSEPSFIENYIVVNTSNLNKFSELSPARQEKHLVETLIHASPRRDYDSASNNEFYQYGSFSSLDRFNGWGAATGVMPTLKFPEVRKFLLEVLKACPAGTWVSTESLIAYLKANHPYFLIPEHHPKKDRWGKEIGRYDNFHESKDNHSTDRKTVPANAPDAFERVEGRYIERFLEDIPLTMRFVEVGYDPNPYTGLLPTRGMLKAFCVTERFQRLMSEQEASPKVTVQPNFDVVIESDFYPAKIIRQVAALGEQVSSPQNGHSVYVGIFLLKKAAVAAEQVKNPDLDVIELLKNLSGRDLPSNVQIELDEWVGHAEQFTLYDGFSLLEMADLPIEAEKFIAEKISPSLRLVRSPEKAFSMLETLGHVPLRIQHPAWELAPIAESAQSVFPKESAWIEAQKTAKQVKVSRVVTISYRFPDAESFDAIQKTLAELRCPFQSDPVTRIVNIQQKEQTRFDEAVQKLQDIFAIEIE
ncbi:MAG: hypothetical protein L6461_23735 [Anaerolineae bacterium]|nr:hypothetical protein [Anaerolineae bacterium]